MALLAQGDRGAFDPLFRALHPRALRLARARLGQDHAGDAAQSALLKVFARASEFTPGRPVLPWFYAVVANEVRSVGRKRAACSAGGDDEALALEAPGDPERELLQRELAAALERAVQELDAPCAEAIGALLGHNPRPEIEASAFRKRVSRAYGRLRVLLGGFDGE